MKTKEQKREDWLASSRKVIDSIRELRKEGLGNPQYSDEMRKDMEEFMQRVENEDKPDGAPRGRI
jgi:hypothetical protein